jgi:3'(2'), 5'-bisphosphate nucleotidase
MMDLTPELALACRLARAAGAIILEHRRPGLTVDRKAHDEPVTAADREANELILAALLAAFPHDAILSEEAPAIGAYRTAARAWMVDPLDGTRDYVRGLDGFSVMIGLALDGVPALGVVYQPLGERLYRAVRGQGAVLEEPGDETRLTVSRTTDPGRALLVSSASHRTEMIDAVRAALGIKDEIRLGSVGLKLGLIASGTRDLYVNPSQHSKLWDVCAPEAILAEAGGRLTDLRGRPIDYRRAELANRDGLLATNGHLHDEIVRRLAPLLPPPTTS